MPHLSHEAALCSSELGTKLQLHLGTTSWEAISGHSWSLDPAPGTQKAGNTYSRVWGVYYGTLITYKIGKYSGVLR